MLILEEDVPPTDMRTLKSQSTSCLTDGTVFLDEESVKIVNFDLYQ